ncbi:hypothetical protein BGZ59_003022, partial [Podila verticillata]
PTTSGLSRSLPTSPRATRRTSACSFGPGPPTSCPSTTTTVPMSPSTVSRTASSPPSPSRSSTSPAAAPASPRTVTATSTRPPLAPTARRLTTTCAVST